jgi:hypothetical protein
MIKPPFFDILQHTFYKPLHIPGNDQFDVYCILHGIASKYLRKLDKQVLPFHFLNS